MTVFKFDVTVSTHEDLKSGRLAIPVNGSQHAHHRVVIETDNDVDASLTAALMASEYGIVTGIYPRI